MMKIIYLVLCLFVCQVTTYSQWARLMTPQSEVLGQRLVNRSLAGNSIPQSAVVTKGGVDQQTEFVKKDIETNFGLGTFEFHKFRDATINGVKVDYIDYDYLKHHNELHNNWIVYKGLRAEKITLIFDRTVKTGVTPAMLINAITPKVKNFTKVEDIKFDFTDINKTTVTITNPQVYFRVQIAKLELNERRTVVAFDTSNTIRSYKLTFPNNREKARMVDLGNNIRPRFQIALEQDSTGKLGVFIHLPDDFARANNLKNPYPVEQREIGPKIFEYRVPNKTIGIISNNNEDYFIKFDLEGTKISENEVEFKHRVDGSFRTAIRFPYVKFNTIDKIE